MICWCLGKLLHIQNCLIELFPLQLLNCCCFLNSSGTIIHWFTRTSYLIKVVMITIYQPFYIPWPYSNICCSWKTSSNFKLNPSFKIWGQSVLILLSMPEDISHLLILAWDFVCLFPFKYMMFLHCSMDKLKQYSYINHDEDNNLSKSLYNNSSWQRSRRKLIGTV